MTINKQLPNEKNDTGSGQPPLMIKFQLPKPAKNESSKSAKTKVASLSVAKELDEKKHEATPNDLDMEIEALNGNTAFQAKQGTLLDQDSSRPPKLERSAGNQKRKLVSDSIFDGDLSDDSESTPTTRPVSKKAKQAQPNKDDIKDSNVRSFNVYIEIWSTTTIVEPKRSAGRPPKQTTIPDTVTKGPFNFNTSRSFSEFQREVAQALPCREALLPVSRFEWKFEKEARSAPRKKISDIAGFNALIDAITAKRMTENVVVWLYLPKPKKDIENWDTGHSDYVDRAFDFDVERQEKTTKEHIDEMAEKRSTAVVALESEYPVGKFPLFAGKRIWQNKTTGSYFELTPMRIRVWATAIAAGTADLSAPPTSAHFTEDKKIKGIPTGIGSSAQAPAPSTTDAPAFPGYPPPPPAGYHPYHSPQYIPGYPYSYAPPFAMPAMVHAMAVQPSLPSRATMSHSVSLAEFCDKYGISDKDRGKLEILEYTPGNPYIERVDEKDWREIAGFTKIGWEAVLNAHHDFCTGVMSRNLNV